LRARSDGKADAAAAGGGGVGVFDSKSLAHQIVDEIDPCPQQKWQRGLVDDDPRAVEPVGKLSD
jgi:hypothetical protein